MNKKIHPAICYALIIVCALFSSVFIYNISTIKYPDAFASIQIKTPKKTPVPPPETQAPTENLVVQTRSLSDIFNNPELAKRLKADDGKFIFNEIVSNSGDKIVYAELSNCPKGICSPDQAWNYDIKIFDASKGTTTTIYNQNNDKESPTYHGGIIYYPIAWSKTDKKIILTWNNFSAGGQGFSPSTYALLDTAGGKLENPGAFIDCSAIIFDNNNEALTATNKNGSVACAEGDEITDEQIIVTNAETGKTTVIVGKKNGFGHAIKSFDSLTKILTYSTFPCTETGLNCEVAQGAPFETKEITITTR